MLAWLIRHAQSEANFGLATSDPGTSPLTERGWAQARHLAAGLHEPPTLIVTSPFLRTKQTAQPTRERFPRVPHKEWPVQEFTYLHSLHGQVTTAVQRRPMVDAYWRRADPSYAESPGVETFAGLLARAREMVERLQNRDGDAGPVAVFTHGMFIRAVVWALMTRAAAPAPESMRLFRAFTEVFRIPNAAVLDLNLSPDGASAWVVGGRIAHLPAALATGR